jgi:hypothetical protein
VAFEAPNGRAALGASASRDKEHWLSLPTHYLFAPIAVGVGETYGDPL